MRHRVRILGIVCALVLAGAGASGASSSAASPAPAGGTWVPLGPSTVFAGSIAAGATQRITVAAVPAGATAWITVDVRDPAVAGSVRAYTAGGALPSVPALSFAAHQGATNIAVVPVSSAHQLAVRNFATAAVSAQVSVAGYYVAGAPTSAGGFGAVSPTHAANALTVPAHGTANITVAGVNGVPADAGAVALDLVTSATDTSGLVRAYPRDGAAPDAASLAYSAGRPAATTTVVPVGSSGQLTVANGGDTPVALSTLTFGYFLRGTPSVARTLVTRPSTLLFDTSSGGGPLAGQTYQNVPVIGRAGVPAGADAVVVALTASLGASTGSVTAYASGASVPAVPTLRYSAGRTTVEDVVVPLGPDGQIAIRNSGSDAVQVRGDVIGYYGYASTLTWGAPTRVSNVGQADLSTVSCTTTNFCLSLDQDGSSLRWDGSTWTRTLRAVPPGVYLLSCTSSSFCLAVAPGRFARKWDGTRWTSVGAAPADALSCVTPQFCVAVGGAGNTTAVWNGSSFTTAVPPPGNVTLDVSCSAVNVCIGLFTLQLNPTQVISARFNGTNWVAKQTVPGLTNDASLSCPGSFCLAVDDYNHAAKFNGTAWTSAPKTPVLSYGGTSLSCRSAHFCAMVGSSGDNEAIAEPAVATFNGSSWSASTYVVQFVTARHPGMSCPQVTFCVAVAGPAASVYNGTSWTSSPTIDPDAGTPLTNVSCASASFCVAAGRHDAHVWNGTSWAPPADLGTFDPAPGDYNSVINDLSCVSSTFCVGALNGGDDITTGGGWVTYDGTNWTVVDQHTTPGQWSVSCVSTTYCVSVSRYYDSADPSGARYEAWAYDGTSWTKSGQFAKFLNRVSCVSATSCVAIGQPYGEVKAWSRWDGTSWTPVATFGDTVGRVQDLGCLSATRCVAVDDQGRAFTFDGTTWSSATIATKALTRISCELSAACIAVGPGVSAVQYLGRGTWSAPFGVGTVGDTTAISCPTASFCLATDANGYATIGRT